MTSGRDERATVGTRAVRDQASMAQVRDVIVRRPWRVVLLTLFVFLAFGVGVRGLEKDPSVDAFVPDDHPAALARDRGAELFGLEDPIVVGLSSSDGGSVFTPEALTALRAISEAARTIPGVKKNDIVSLATENAISGQGGDLAIDPVLEAGQIDEGAAARAWSRVQSMPMMLDLLAARDASLVTILIPVEDPDHAEAQVEAVRALATGLAPDTLRVSIAGVATMNAELGRVVNGDTARLVPAAVLAVLATILIALRQWRAVIGPLVVIVMSVVVSVGTMGWIDARYYLITTALPIVIMAIAVADSLHLSTAFLRHRRLQPADSAGRAVTAALSRTALPISLTSLTTMAGFIGLSVGTAMRPISEFGLFAALGVAAAWLLSLTVLPAILVITDLGPKAAGRPGTAPRRRLDALVAGITKQAVRRPETLLVPLAIIASMIAIAASHAEFDYERKRYFAGDTAVRAADAELNTRLGGINFLDVIVESPDEGGLMTPAALASIAELKAIMADDPVVSQVVGIDDYIATMHRALTDAAPGTLPTRERAPAQYMFLYEASGAPEDFRQEIDYTHSVALVRAQLATDQFKLTRQTVERLDRQVSDWSERSGLSATLSGRVAVNVGWMERLSETHFVGLGLAALLVCLATAISFRAITPTLLALVPVSLGVLSVYAVMGLANIDIAPATSMAAAISTGLGVDFGIHLVAHVRRRLAEGVTIEAALGSGYVTVARACFYSAAALGIGLSVLLFSSAPPLRWFGTLIAAGAAGSLLGALLILPPLMKFLARRARQTFDERTTAHA